MLTHIPRTTYRGMIIPGTGPQDGEASFARILRQRSLCSRGRRTRRIVWSPWRRHAWWVYRRKALTYLEQTYDVRLEYYQSRHATHPFEVVMLKFLTAMEIPIPTPTESAPYLKVNIYTRDQGLYIGSPEWGLELIRMQVKPEARAAGEGFCSMGFSRATARWFGWNSLGVASFGIGSTIRAGMQGYWAAGRGQWTAANFEEARTMAGDFARSAPPKKGQYFAKTSPKETPAHAKKKALRRKR